MIIEIQIISYLLTQKKEFITKYNITPDMFYHNKEEFAYIFNYINKYDKVPDYPTFFNVFSEFETLTVTEPEDKLYIDLVENTKYIKMVEGLQKIAPEVADNPSVAHEKLRQLLIDLDNMGNNDLKVISMFEQVDKYKESFITKNEFGGLLGIPTGIDILDELLSGWLRGEELALIMARTNEGKSWLLFMFMLAAWKNGEKVLLYSGEMGDEQVFNRFVTWLYHISNSGITNGKDEVKDEYFHVIERLKNHGNPFYILTPEELGGNQLDCFILEKYIKKIEPTIIGIDQISLMQDYRKVKGQPLRTDYCHISEDLFNLSIKYKLPILVDVQAGRSAVKGSSHAGKEPPRLSDIQEADGIGQNATRIISFRQQENNEMDMVIRKNRFGKRDDRFNLSWDIDKGILKFKQYHTEESSKKSINKSEEEPAIWEYGKKEIPKETQSEEVVDIF